MGRDYRIGLVAGLALAAVTLVWVATRPSFGPRPQPEQGSDQNTLAADKPMPLLPTVSTSEADTSGRRKTEDRGPRAEDRRQNPPLFRAPSSGAPDPAVQGNTEPIKTPRFHVVRQGETLSAIAQQYYGSTNSWRKILAANEKTIKDANKIAVGTKLIIP